MLYLKLVFCLFRVEFADACCPCSSVCLVCLSVAFSLSLSCLSLCACFCFCFCLCRSLSLFVPLFFFLLLLYLSLPLASCLLPLASCLLPLSLVCECVVYLTTSCCPLCAPRSRCGAAAGAVQVASCDVKGKPRQFEREMLFSKMDKVSDVAKQLSEANKVRAHVARTCLLWEPFFFFSSVHLVQFCFVLF